MAPLHHQLRGLVEQYGPQVLEDPDGLRAVLRDVSPSGGPELAGLDLVSQAVRCGAYAELKSRLTGGTPPLDAVEAAARLLLERTMGVDSALAWRACATLGYALGGVPEPLVTEGPGVSRSKTVTTPDPANPERLRLIGLLASVVVLALVAGSVTLFLANRNEDPADTAVPGSETTTDTADPGSPTTTDPTPDSQEPPPPPVRDTVSDLFNPLGAAITAWVPRDGCSDRQFVSGRYEYRCEIRGFDLRLRMHSDVSDLVEFRRSVLNTSPEQIISHKKTLGIGRGTYFLRRANNNITLYWDNLPERQSAYLRVPESVMTLEQVQQFYRSRRAPLGEPKTFEWAYMPSWDKSNRGMDCTRALTVSEGQLEVTSCTNGTYTIRYVKVDDRTTLEKTRNYFRAQTMASEQPWNYESTPNVDRGAQIYFEGPKRASRIYWDHTTELWWGLIYAPDNRRDAIFNFWSR